MKRYWSKFVDRLDPYRPGEQPQDRQFIKLNTNENPFPPCPAIAGLLREFASEDLRRYPDPESRDLVSALARYHRLAEDQVFVGNGSDEVLAHGFQALLQQDRPILFPDISYSFYPVYCGLYQIDFERVPLDPEFRIDIGAFTRANGGIVLSNPNAPTGIALSRAQLRQLLEANRESAVMVDEAYVDFGAESAVPLIEEFDNLLVVQTFSKSRSLAGLRLGYALGQRDLITALQRVKNSFNSYPVDRLASAIGIASLEDEAYFRYCREQVIASRERLGKGLGGLGFEVFPSQSNFLFVRHRAATGLSLYQALKQAGILVRHFDTAGIDNCLRITIGSDEECDALLTALGQILNHGNR